MTSISQQINLPQAPNNASQAVAPSHSPSSSTSGKTSGQPAALASGKSTYANATKAFPPSVVSGSPGPSGPPPSQHGKPDANSPVNGRIVIPPAVPAVGSPTIVNGNTPTSATSGFGDHVRKPSVTINGAATQGKSPGSNIQFGAMSAGDSPAARNASPLPSQSSSSLAVAPSNPRMSSPQTSPSPIPQPPASGGKPPSSLHGPSNSVNFGNFGGGEAQMRPSSNPQGSLMAGPQSTHLRRESSQSQHSDVGGPGVGPGAGRGGYPQQGGRGRNFASPYQQQMGYPSAPNFRPPPNQPRNGNMNFQQQNRSYQQYPGNSPHQAPRQPHSPMPPNAQPLQGQPGQMPMQAPHMGQPQYGGYPGQPYGYPPNMGPQQGYYPMQGYVNSQDPSANWYQIYGPGSTPPALGPPQSPRPNQYPPGPQTPFQSQYVQQPPPMSRTSSAISGTDRPASSMGRPQSSATPAPNTSSTAGRTSTTPAPKPNQFQKPKRSTGIVIKDPNSGEVVDLKHTASPAPSNKSSSSISAAPTPPPRVPSNTDSSHARTESKSVTKTDGKELREQLARQLKERDEADAKAAQEKKDAEIRLQEEKAEADAKQQAAAKAQMDAEEAEKKDRAAALEAEQAAAKAEEKAEETAEAAKKKVEEPPEFDEEEIARWEAEEAEEAKREAEREAAYNRKKKAEKDEAARKEAEAFKMADEEMKKAEREAEEAEEARLHEMESSHKAKDKPDEGSDTPSNIPGTPEVDTTALEETPVDSGVATPGSDAPPPSAPDRKPAPSAAKQKPAGLKLETNKPVEPPQPSAALTSLRSSRKLTSLDITYPEGKASPNPALNAGAKAGKFRYDMSFLLQFKSAFTEKPSENWAEKIKETVGDTAEPQSARGTPRTGGGGSMMSGRQPSNRAPPSMQQMGAFGQPARTLPTGTTSEQRFQASSQLGPRGMGAPPRPMQNPLANYVNPRPGGAFPQPPGSIKTDRTPSSTSMHNPNSPRNASQRGGSQRGPRAVRREDPKDNKTMPLTAGGNVKPIEISAGGWKPMSVGVGSTAGPAPGGDGHMAPDVVQRKVKSNLNKMTPNNFDKIAGQILAIAHQSKDETDGRSLRQVIQLTFEKATDEAHWAEMYAQFCKRMLESMSPEIQDKNILDRKGDIVSGGGLFRKYLLTRCQTEFERGWKMNLPEKPEGETEEAAMLSDEYYIAAAAKRRGLGLVRFIGELYKLGMLTERIMHECVKKLVDYEGMPDEAEVESLTSLLKTIGQQLDASEKGHSMMDAYFARMGNMVAIKDLPSRLRFMLMDVIDLRTKNRWQAKGGAVVKGPTTLDEVRSQAVEAERQKEAQRAQDNSRRGGGGGGGRPPIGRGDARNFSGGGGGQFGPPPPDYHKNTVGMDDLRRLGSKNPSRAASSNAPQTFGPPSMFASARGSNTRKPLTMANANDSGASSRMSTPPGQKEKKDKEKEEAAKSGANAFSVLATSDPSGDAGSPGTSPGLAKAQPAISEVTKDQKSQGDASKETS